MNLTQAICLLYIKRWVEEAQLERTLQGLYSSVFKKYRKGLVANIPIDITICGGKRDVIK